LRKVIIFLLTCSTGYKHHHSISNIFWRILVCGRKWRTCPAFGSS